MGKRWGNQLSKGYLTQRRGANGKWAGGVSTGLGGKKSNKKALKTRGAQSKFAVKQKKAKIRGTGAIHKNPATSLTHKYNRSQAAFTSGALTRQAGVVPYTRHSFSSHSAGINGGLRVLPNYRISGGAQIKIQNIDKTRREKALRREDERIVLGVTERISPHRKLDPYIGAIIKKVRRNQVDKLVGGEAKVGKKSYARLTTDQNAMPTLTIEHNRKKARTVKRTRGKDYRRKGIWAYNDMVMKNRSSGTHVKPPRPARRKSGKG